MATEIVGATAKILPRKRGSGRGSVASIWPFEPAVNPIALRRGGVNRREELVFLR